MSDAVIYAWREEQGDVWTGEWALDRADKWVPAEAKKYILAEPVALAASPEVAALIREAEARGMERAAAYHDAEVAELEKQVEENSEYLRRWHNEADAYANVSEANDHCRTNITAHRISAADIRAEAAAIRGEGK